MTYNYFADITSWMFILFIIGNAIHTLVGSCLSWRNSDRSNLRGVLKTIYGFHKTAPKLFSTAKVKKAIEYKKETDSFSDFHDVFSSNSAIIFTLFGILPFFIDQISIIFGISHIMALLICTAATTVIDALTDFPFDWYANMKIEQKYGFNKMTTGSMVIDSIKSCIVDMPIDLGMLYLLYLTLTVFGPFSPIAIVILVGGMIVVGNVLGWLNTNVFAYWFNEYIPLKDRSLSKRIANLVKSCGARIDRILIVDGSTRSTHSNAYVTGLFRKRIVIFDNLLKTHTNDEILSIVGHEIGHARLHHILIGTVASAVELLAVMFIVFSVIYNPALYHTFGFSWVTEQNIVENSVFGFSLAMMLISSVRWILEPFHSWMSRKMEYAADRYSVEHTGKKTAMITSLLKLHSDNLADIAPDRWYEVWNYSHPSIVNRINAINAIGKRK